MGAINCLKTVPEERYGQFHCKSFKMDSTNSLLFLIKDYTRALVSFFANTKKWLNFFMLCRINNLSDL